MLTPGFRRIEPDDVTPTLELGYPPRSPYFALMRRLSMPPPTLLLRRMEIQLLALLGELHAGADWGADHGRASLRGARLVGSRTRGPRLLRERRIRRRIARR